MRAPPTCAARRTARLSNANYFAVEEGVTIRALGWRDGDEVRWIPTSSETHADDNGFISVLVDEAGCALPVLCRG